MTVRTWYCSSFVAFIFHRNDDAGHADKTGVDDRGHRKAIKKDSRA
jgi:hypothetical protein